MVYDDKRCNQTTNFVMYSFGDTFVMMYTSSNEHPRTLPLCRLLVVIAVPLNERMVYLSRCRW